MKTQSNNLASLTKLLLLFVSVISRTSQTIMLFPHVRSCECVPFMQCNEDGTMNVDGVGIVDVRMNSQKFPIKDYPAARDYKQSRLQSASFNYNHDDKDVDRECENILEVCCEPNKITKQTSHFERIASKQCGAVRKSKIDSSSYNSGAAARIYKGKEARHGEFPWIVAVLGKGKTKIITNLQTTAADPYYFLCGGSLIHPRVVLTSAHCVDDYSRLPTFLKIRTGNYDYYSLTSSDGHQDREVESVVIHENYSPKSLHNDVAILILTDSVDTSTSDVNVVCLPEFKHDYDKSNCLVAGWGKNKFSNEGRYQEVLKKARLTVVPPLDCQDKLRESRLGQRFRLDQSFLCAQSAATAADYNGEGEEDACVGDGGGPLVCPLNWDKNIFVQVGIVSWGIDCGKGMPGVYSSTLFAGLWIDHQLLFHNFDSTLYKYRHIA